MILSGKVYLTFFEFVSVCIKTEKHFVLRAAV